MRIIGREARERGASRLPLLGLAVDWLDNLGQAVYTSAQHERKGRPVTDQCENLACELLDLLPRLMGILTSGIREHPGRAVSVPQWTALACLRDHPGVSVAELARQIGVSPSACSRMVETLRDRGLVTQAMDPADARRARLSLSATGRATLEVKRRFVQQRFAEALAAANPGERRTLAGGLELLRRLILESPPPAAAS